MIEGQKEKDKLRKEELKHEGKTRKEEERAAIAELKRQSKEDKRQDKAATMVEVAAPDPPTDGPQPPADPPVVAPAATKSVLHRSSRLQVKNRHSSTFPVVEKPKEAPAALDGSSSPTSKMKNWLRSRFSSRPRARSSVEPGSNSKKSFIGGHALLHTDGTGSMTSLDRRSESMREVALAGRIPPLQPRRRRDDEVRLDRDSDPDPAPGSLVSSLHSSDDESTFAPPRPIRDLTGKKSASPVRDSRFLEDL